MSRISLLALVLAACSRHLPAPPPAPAWRWVNPRPTGSSLTRAFADGARVWAVGEAGTILRSDDGGATFTLQPSGTTEDLTGVTGDRGGVVAVGGHGTIVATTDGATWVPQHSPTDEALADVWANGHGRTFAVGAHGTVLVSTNGGASWIALSSGTRAGLRAVRGARDDTLYAAGAGGVLLRAEGDAATWQRRDTGTTDDLTDLHVTAAGDVIAVGGSVVVRSSDKGASFHAAPPPRGATLVGVGGRGAEVLVCGAGGALFRSRDAGASFTQLEPPVPTTLASIAGSVVVGGFGTLLRLDGDHVVDAAPGPRALLTAVAGAGGKLWAVGADGTLLAGPPLAPVATGAVGLLAGVAAGPEGVFVVGAGGVVLHARPGGAFAPEPSGTTRALHGVAAAGRVLAVGDHGTVLERANGTWSARPAVTASDLAAVWTRGPLAVAVGARGTILRDDVVVASGAATDWLAVAGTGDEVWAVGRGGAALRSADAGRTWIPFATGVTVDLTGVAVDADGVRIVGDRGTILHGRAPEPSGTVNTLTGISGRFVVGAGGTVLERSP